MKKVLSGCGGEALGSVGEALGMRRGSVGDGGEVLGMQQKRAAPHEQTLFIE